MANELPVVRGSAEVGEAKDPTTFGSEFRQSDLNVPMVLLAADLSQVVRDKRASAGDLYVSTDIDDDPFVIGNAEGVETLVYVISSIPFVAEYDRDTRETTYVNKVRAERGTNEWEGNRFWLWIPSYAEESDIELPVRWRLFRTAGNPARKKINTRIAAALMQNNGEAPGPLPFKLSTVGVTSKDGTPYHRASVEYAKEGLLDTENYNKAVEIATTFSSLITAPIVVSDEYESVSSASGPSI